MIQLMVDAVFWLTLCAGFWWVARLQERIACLEVILFERSEPVVEPEAIEESPAASDQFPAWK